LIVIFTLIYVILYIIAALKPKLGAYLIWPAMWLYPGGLLHSLLPLNMRFDDIYIIWVPFVIFIYSFGKKEQKSKVLLFAWLWFFAILMGNITGSLGTPLMFNPILIRNIAKRLYIPLIAYAVWKTATDEESIKKHIIWIFIAGFLTMAIGIVQVKAPYLTIIWENPGWLYEVDTYSKDTFDEDIRRAGGSLETMYYSVTAMSLFILGWRFFLIKPTKLLKFIGVFSIVISGLGLIYSNTRGTIAGALIGVLYMMIRQRKRVVLITLSSFIVLYLILGTSLLERVTSRFEIIEGQGQYKYDIRTFIWSEYLKKVSPLWLFFGRGMIPEQVRVGYSAHSSFVGGLAYTGLLGCFITFMLLFYIWKYSRDIILLKTPLTLALGQSILAILWATLFSALFIEVLQGHHMRLLVALGILAERTYYHLCQQTFNNDCKVLYYED